MYATLRGPEVDALWELAPPQTEVAVVLSTRGVALGAGLLETAHALSALPELETVRPVVDAALVQLYGSPEDSALSSGLSLDRGMAVFVRADGIIALLPVANRELFVRSRRGVDGAEPVIGNWHCRPWRQWLECDTHVGLVDELGKASLRGRFAGAPLRGDVEVYVRSFDLLGASGPLDATMQLERGQLEAWAHWDVPHEGVLAALAAHPAPPVDATDATGVAAFDLSVAPPLPAIPLYGDVTLEQLGRSFAGPVALRIAAGTLGLEARVPLADVGPAKTLIEHCDELQFIDRPPPPAHAPHECRFIVRAARPLSLLAWIEGGELHIAPQRRGVAAAMRLPASPVVSQLLHGPSLVAWGRGTLLADPPAGDVADGQLLGVRALSWLDELGIAVWVAGDRGVDARLFVRTIWADPPAVADAIVHASAESIARGELRAADIAPRAPASAFATDSKLGAGGMIIPAALIGVALRALAPEAEPPPGGERVDKKLVTTFLLRALVEEGYPRWAKAHAPQTCPPSLADVANLLAGDPDIPKLVDPWGHALVMKCGRDLPAGAPPPFAVISTGPDGVEGTADDVRSWDHN